MESPFTCSRLIEMRREGWRVDQIITLAAALTGEVATPDEVQAWYEEANIGAPLVVTPPSPPARKPRCNAAARHEVKCDRCGVLFERHDSRVRKHNYCSNTCYRRHQLELQAKRRELAASLTTDNIHLAVEIGLVPATHWCRACEQELPVAAFALDRTRTGNLKPICRECQARQYRAWYHNTPGGQKHRERVLEACRKKRGQLGGSGEDTP